MKKRTHSLQQNETGLVSIVVTLIIMIVLTLIVLGFAQMARREQRLTLDRQLSTQAAYAAESGINDAKRAIFAKEADPNNPYNISGGSKNKNECPPDGDPGSNGDPNSILSSSKTSNKLSDSVSYSCLLINQVVEKQEFSNVSTAGSTIITYNAVDEDGEDLLSINALSLSWQSTDTGAPTIYSGPEAYPSLPQEPLWRSTKTNVGILRVDVIPVTDLSRGSLMNNQFTVFLYPGGNEEFVDYAPNNPNSDQQGKLIHARCNGPDVSAGKKYFCNAQITNLSTLGSKFVLRVRSLYTDSRLEVGSPDPDSYSKGGQVEIDATGKAQDVLKRVRVRVPFPGAVPSSSAPENALDVAAGICKLISAAPGAGNTSDLCDGATPPAVVTNPSVNGNAQFASGCTVGVDPGCIAWTPSPSTPQYNYKQWFWNKSVNTGANFTGCTWSFGDGTTSHDKCQPGDSISHTYNMFGATASTPPTKCYTYTITLTRTFSDAPPAKYTDRRSVPSGTEGADWCRSHGGYKSF